MIIMFIMIARAVGWMVARDGMVYIGMDKLSAKALFDTEF